MNSKLLLDLDDYKNITGYDFPTEARTVTQPANPVRNALKKTYPEIYAALVARDGELCQACGSVSNLTIDHITAVAKGGGNEIDNLQILCKSCNSRKGARS